MIRIVRRVLVSVPNVRRPTHEIPFSANSATKHASTGSRKCGTIVIPVRILNDANHVLIRLDIAVGGVDKRARLYRIYEGAPRLRVQCDLRIKYIVDNLKCVNPTACRPIRRNSIGPECGPHGTPGKMSVRQSLTMGFAKRV